MKKIVNVQPPEERLIEVDRVILNTSQQGCDLLRRGAPVSEVDSAIEFLRTLYRRRDVILAELKKKGISEKQVYDQIRNVDGGNTARYELDRYMVR